MQEAYILIMDDKAGERKRIGDLLVQKGYDMLAIGTVAEAVDAFRRERFDVFLTDFNIPGVDELRTLNTAHKINPEAPGTIDSNLFICIG